MNFIIYVLAFLAGICGILFHIFAVKIPSVKDAAKAGNIQFSYKQYFIDDITGILTSLLTLIIYLFILKELITYKPILEGWVIAFSVLVGFCGSSILLKILGTAQGKINDLVDPKTNIADKISPPSPPTPTV